MTADENAKKESPATNEALERRIRGLTEEIERLSAEAEARAAALHHLVVEPGGCRITRRAPATLDPGAFGKGEALDRVREAEGDRPGVWLVDLRGQVASRPRRANPGRSPSPNRRSATRQWPISNCAAAHSPPAAAPSGTRERPADAASVTSSDSRSGRPVRRRSSAVVWHRKAFAADALSTVFLVPGPGSNKMDLRMSPAAREVPAPAAGSGPSAGEPASQ